MHGNLTLAAAPFSAERTLNADGSSSPLDPLFRKLAIAHPPDEDWQALAAAASLHPRKLTADATLVHQGDEAADCFILLEGLGCRYKLLPEGRRQITGFVVPGDMVGFSELLMGRTDHSVTTLSPSRVAVIPRNTAIELTTNFMGIARALWRDCMVEASIAREWVANVGQRSPPQRLAHLFCEMHHRLRVAGLVQDGSYEWPVTQGEMGDAIGTSLVHANRSLKHLRGLNLVEVTSHRVTIRKLADLETFAEFTPEYLYHS